MVDPCPICGRPDRPVATAFDPDKHCPKSFAAFAVPASDRILYETLNERDCLRLGVEKRDAEIAKLAYASRALVALAKGTCV